MLSEAFILKYIEPYLNHKNELSEFEFLELFSGLNRIEQYEVINIMIKNNIEYVYEKDEESENLLKVEVLSTNNNDGDYNKLKHLSNEQLCLMAQKGDNTALSALLNNNKRFVYKIALKLFAQFHQTSLTVDDLYQEGNIGLIEAVQRFDISLDLKFLTYSWHWIRQKITRAAIDTGYIIRLPVHVFEKIVKISICRKKNPMADIDELLYLLNAEISDNQYFTRENLVKLLAYNEQYLNTTSLNLIVGEGEDTELMDFVLDDSLRTTDDLVTETLLREELYKVLESLTLRESKVIRLRFGLDDDIERTLEEVGREFNVTRERIRQIEAKALRKLRHPSRCKKIIGYLD